MTVMEALKSHHGVVLLLTSLAAHRGWETKIGPLLWRVMRGNVSSHRPVIKHLHIKVMLFKIDNHKSDVIFAIVVCTALVSYHLWNLQQSVLALLSKLVNLLAYLLLSVNQVESISRDNQKVIGGGYLVMKSLWLWNNKLFILHISNRSANRQCSVHSPYIILLCHKSIWANNSIIFVLSVGGLLFSKLDHLSVLLEKNGSWISNISNSHFAVVNHAQEEGGTCLNIVFARMLQELIIQVFTNYNKVNQILDTCRWGLIYSPKSLKEIKYKYTLS